MGTIIPVFRGTAGFTNKLSPIRVPHSTPDIVGLITAVNVEYDDTGMPKRRNGRSLIASGSFHSIFGNEDHGFVVSGGCLYVISPDYSINKIRSNLTDVQMYYCKTNQGVYYSNMFENGVIKNFLSYPWPVQIYDGPFTDAVFSPAPVGKCLAVHNGRMLIANGRYLYYSEPYKFGLFDLNSYLPFNSDIKMVKPTSDGVYVSDSESVFFCSGNDITEMSIKQVESYPALSCVQEQIKGSDLGMDDQSYQWVWYSYSGFIAGGSVGNTKNLTSDMFNPPKIGTRGASVFTGSNIIQCIF
jgi:hypothetical protein